MSLESIIDVLEASGIKLEPDMLADCLYLAAFRLAHDESVTSQPIPNEPEKAAESGSDDDDESDEEELPEETSKSDSESDGSSEREGFDVFPPALNSEDSSKTGRAFRTPGGRALPQSREILKALRPIMVRRASRRAYEIDVAKTVHEIAHTGVCSIALRPSKERWIDLAIVVDQTPSMHIWSDAVDEFRRHIDSHGGFRRVSHWSLTPDTEDGKALAIRRLNSRQLRSHRELCNSSRNQLILILTDCVSDMWTHSHLPNWFEDWGRRSSVAIVQVFPQRLWPQTNLAQFRFSEVSCRSDMTPNRLLRNVSRQIPWAKPRQKNGNLVPLTTFLPESLNSFSKSIAGGRAVRLPAFDLSEKRNSTRATPVSTDRLRAFLKNASPLARQLARLLSAAPLRLPVMRLVQRVMLPQSRQDHLAEFYLSGLIKKTDGEVSSSAPEELQYEFITEDIRAALLNDTLVPEAVKVLELVSQYIAETHGTTIDFLSVMSGETVQGELPASPLAESFARISTLVARSMGIHATPLTITTANHTAVGDEQGTLGRPQVHSSIQEELDTLLVAAGSALAGNELGRAEESVNSALELCKTAGDAATSAQLLFRTGDLYAQHFNLERAISSFEASLQAYKAIGDIRGVCAASCRLAKAEADFGRLEASLLRFTEALTLSSQLGDAALKISCHGGLAQVLEKLDRLDDALRHYDEALNDNVDDQELVRGRFRVLARLGRHTESLEIIQRTVSEQRESNAAESTKINPDLANTLSDLAATLKEVGEVHGAVEAYTEALQIRRQYAKSHPDVYLPEVAATLHNLGSVLCEMNLLDEAMGSYQESLKIRHNLVEAFPRDLSQRHELSKLLQQMAEIHIQTKEFDEGLKLLEQSMEIKEELAKSNPSNMSFQRDLTAILRQLGDIHQRLGEVSIPQSYYNIASGTAEIGDANTETEPGHSGDKRESTSLFSQYQLVDIFVGPDRLVGVGIVIAPHRILTTEHIVPWDTDVVLRMSDGSTHKASVIWVDRKADLALLECPSAPPQQRHPEIGGKVSATINSVILTRSAFKGTSGGPISTTEGRVFGITKGLLELDVDSDQEIMSGSPVFTADGLVAIVQARRGNQVVAIPLTIADSNKGFLDALGSRENANAPTVFLSYSRRDMAFVHRLRDEIVSWGFKCQIDGQEVVAVDEIITGIADAVTSADVFLVVLSEARVSSKLVSLEVDIALRWLKSARIVSLAIDDCRIPSSLEKYPVLRVDQSADLSPLESVLRLGTAPRKERIDLSKVLSDVAAIYADLPSPSLREAMLASIGGTPFDYDNVSSPERIAGRFSSSIDELKNYHIVLDRRQAVVFIHKNDPSTSVSAIEKTLTGAKYKRMLGRSPSRHRNMFVFTYAELACVTGFNVHASLPSHIREAAAELARGDNQRPRNEIINDSELLIRRIHPRQIIFDTESEEMRPSPAAFSHDSNGTAMSMSALSMLQNPETELRDHPGHRLVSIPAKTLRELGLYPRHSPTDSNPARVLVEGDLNRRIRSILARRAEFYFTNNSVLLVEDDKYHADVYINSLSEFSVTHVPSAEDALHHVTHDRACDAVIIDMMMRPPKGEEQSTHQGRDTGLWLLEKIAPLLSRRRVPIIIQSLRHPDTIEPQARAIARECGISTKLLKVVSKLETSPRKLSILLTSLLRLSEQPLHNNWVPKEFERHEGKVIDYLSTQEAKALAQSIVLYGLEQLKGYESLIMGHYRAISSADIEQATAVHKMIGQYSERQGVVASPLSFATFGSPGSGKSYWTKQAINSSLSRIPPQYISCNLSQLSTAEELSRVFRSLSDLEEEELGVVLFDEFDCTFQGSELGWLKFFLAPMQDGEFRSENDVFTFPKCILVFLGGCHASFEEFSSTTSTESVRRRAKLPNFVSRLRGHVNIPEFNSGVSTSVVYRAMFFRRYLEANHDLDSTDTSAIGERLVSALLDTSKYRYGFRSMRFILDLLFSRESGRLTSPHVLQMSQLEQHVDRPSAERLVSASSAGTSKRKKKP